MSKLWCELNMSLPILYQEIDFNILLYHLKYPAREQEILHKNSYIGWRKNYSFLIRGSVVVKALCYKPEGRWFETRCELMFSIYLILPAVGFTQPLTEMSTRSRKIMFLYLGIERGWCLGLTVLPPCVSRFSRQCGILNISQTYRHPPPVTRIAWFLIDWKVMLFWIKFKGVL
jgi:hypothetical protein